MAPGAVDRRCSRSAAGGPGVAVARKEPRAPAICGARRGGAGTRAASRRMLAWRGAGWVLASAAARPASTGSAPRLRAPLQRRGPRRSATARRSAGRGSASRSRAGAPSSAGRPRPRCAAASPAGARPRPASRSACTSAGRQGAAPAGFARLSVRPRHPKVDEADAGRLFKKASPSWWRERCRARPRHAGRSGSRDEARGAPASGTLTPGVSRRHGPGAGRDRRYAVRA